MYSTCPGRIPGQPYCILYHKTKKKLKNFFLFLADYACEFLVENAKG